MKKTCKILLASCAALTALQSIGAPNPTTTYSENVRTDNRAYIGLNWLFSSKPGLPSLVFGVRHVKVKSNDHLSDGVDLSIQFNLVNGLTLDRVHALVIGGKRNGFYGIGGGYNFVAGTPMVSGTVGAGNVRLVGDYSIGNGLDGLIQLDTLNKPKSVDKLTTTNGPAIIIPGPTPG